jgi:sugar lactone lactonase YvrE
MNKSILSFALILASSIPAYAQNWSNLGGNALRNGQATAVVGPTTPDLAWSNTDDYSIIAWAPFIMDGRVFTIRESGFPQSGGNANDALVAYDLLTGDELWRITLPFSGDTNTEWIAWIAGVNNGRVYASRASNDKVQPIRAYDATDGTPLWTSSYLTEAFAYDGVVFAPDGDLIVGDFGFITRIDADTGSTVWSTPRSCPVSGNCGGAAAVSSNAVYIDEAAPGGNVITKIDLTTGAVLYSSPIMPGFTDQNSPFISPDENTIYFSRTQNNLSTDFLYAFQDDGSQFIEFWNRPVRWTTSHEHGIGLDGSIYTFLNNNEFVRLDPATGDVLDSAGILEPIGTSNLSPKTAIDANGTVYISNGWGSSPATDGRLWVFSPNLATNYFTINLDRQNQGGPALGGAGTLVMTDRQGVHAWSADCPPDWNGDTVVNSQDFIAFLNDFVAGNADYNGDTNTDSQDFIAFLNDFVAGC